MILRKKCFKLKPRVEAVAQWFRVYCSKKTKSYRLSFDLYMCAMPCYMYSPHTFTHGHN